MKQPLLTIAIPTYNRYHYLKQTLNIIISQQTDDVEILVCDNCSEDDTWAYLSGLDEKVVAFRQESNVGPDQNFISCLTRATGIYVWTLCDDDLPCSNAVESLLGAIRAYNHPPALFITPQPTDKAVSNYNFLPIDCKWSPCNRDEFLDSVGIWFTFGSSTVVRRDAVDEAFIHKQIGTMLVPAAIMFSTVGRSNRAIVSNEPMLYARGDNTGGYNSLIVFTQNLRNLLLMGQEMGYHPRVLQDVYNNNLSIVVTKIIQYWLINVAGLFALTRYSYQYRCFYTRVIPALLKRAIRTSFRKILPNEKVA